jgi:hypothetical protein
VSTTRFGRTHGKAFRTRSKRSFLAFVFLGACCGMTAGAGDAEEKLLDSATTYMRQASGYHVEATISNNNAKSLISADIAGDDYDVTINSGVKVRQVRGRYWGSQDGGKTWHSNNSPDSAIFDFLRAPLMGGKLPSSGRLATVQQSTEGGRTVTLLELRFDPPSDKEFLIRYRVIKAPGGEIWIEQFSGPVTFLGTVVLVDARYSKIDEVARIAPPPSR